MGYEIGSFEYLEPVNGTMSNEIKNFLNTLTAEDGTIRLDPKYILGYIPLEANHHISRLMQAKKEDYNLYNNDIYQVDIPTYEYEENHKKSR